MSSVERVAPSAAPAVADDDLMTGLEDLETTDFVMPRLTIDHDEGVFVDSLSGERNEQLRVVMLGLIKQRVLWPPEVGENNEPPLCRSYNFIEGRPGEKFPWDASGFRPSDTQASEVDGQAVLPCANCNLKDWGSHPNRDIPWCSEQHVFAVLMPVGEGFAPALFTVQRSGMKGSKAYLSSFARSKTPLYTCYTTVRLSGNKRGKVTYFVPSFVKGEATDRDEWPDFAMQYRSIRTFVQTPRSRDTEEQTAPANPTPSAPVPAAPADDDDIPF